MFRPNRIAWIQAASLLGLAACVFSAPTTTPATRSTQATTHGSEPGSSGLSSSFASSGSGIPGTGDRQTFSDLVLNVPPGCAVGSSGPTRNPGNSIRNARLSAVEALAAEFLEVDVQTISGVGSDGGAFEIAAQALSGTLANARIVALWAEVDRVEGDRRRLRQVFALACWPDASVPDLPDPAYPDWLVEPPRDDDRICAVGVAGPTRKEAAQSASALRDAREALAVALESRIEKRIFDDGHGVARIARQVDPSPAALARAGAAKELEEEWYDEQGLGPVGLTGVLYGLACIED